MYFCSVMEHTVASYSCVFWFAGCWKVLILSFDLALVSVCVIYSTFVSANYIWFEDCYWIMRLGWLLLYRFLLWHWKGGQEGAPEDAQTPQHTGNWIVT